MFDQRLQLAAYEPEPVTACFENWRETMDSLFAADTLQYDEEMPSTHNIQLYQSRPSKNPDIPLSKHPKIVDSELLSEDETCSLTSWVLQGGFPISLARRHTIFRYINYVIILS